MRVDGTREARIEPTGSIRGMAAPTTSRWISRRLSRKFMSHQVRRGGWLTEEGRTWPTRVRVGAPGRPQGLATEQVVSGGLCFCGTARRATESALVMRLLLAKHCADSSRGHEWTGSATRRWFGSRADAFDTPTACRCEVPACPTRRSSARRHCPREPRRRAAPPDRAQAGCLRASRMCAPLRSVGFGPTAPGPRYAPRWCVREMRIAARSTDSAMRMSSNFTSVLAFLPPAHVDSR